MGAGQRPHVVIRQYRYGVHVGSRVVTFMQPPLSAKYDYRHVMDLFERRYGL